tara:strand:- start:239 stop:409 length:171 start_codon:yes stop_codon:yes gene_type:complete
MELDIVAPVTATSKCTAPQSFYSIFLNTYPFKELSKGLFEISFCETALFMSIIEKP